MRIAASKNLPHRENGSPAGTSTGGPRTTSRGGFRRLTGRRGPWSSISHWASARASAPAASVPLFGGRGTATGQWPHRLGLSPATRLWCSGRGVSAGAVRSAWSLLWRSRPQGIDVASRWTLEDPVETRRHPLGVIAIVITVSTVILTGGFFLRLPPLPGLGSTRLQRLAVEILLLFLLLL